MGSRHDFGADVLPKLVGNTRTFAHTFRRADRFSAPVLARIIGTLSAYWRAHMDLLGPTPSLAFDDRARPIGTAGAPHQMFSPLAANLGGRIEDSIVGPGSTVAGRVLHAVLFDDVVIGRGAVVADSVVLPGARIGAGTRLRGVIVDANHRVPDGAILEHDAAATEPLVLSSYTAPEETAQYALAG